MESFLLISTVFLLVLQIPIAFALITVFKSLNAVYLQAMSTAGIMLGRAIPAFERKSMTSGQVVSNESIKGKPTLIAFISYSCKRCKAMLPGWNEVYQQYQDQYQFVLIGYGDEVKYAKLLKEKEIRGELLAGQDLFKAFKSKLVAFAYFIDEEGKVQRKGLCESKDDIEDLLGL